MDHDRRHPRRVLAGLVRLYNARAGTSSGALTLASKRRRSSAFISPLLALAVSGAIDFYYVFEQTPIRAKGGSAPCRTRPAT